MRLTRDSVRSTALFAALALVLSACTETGDGGDPAQQHDLQRTPTPSGQELEPVDTSGVQVPTQFDQLVTVEPAWDLPVQSGEDILLSAEETDRALVFRAVGPTGTVLWSAERPRSCSGFVVTEDADGRELAVLTDTEAGDDQVAVVTASAYDLASGAPVWGPVEVPGPHAGPGLVFEAPPEGFMGESGEPVALDPGTGRRIAAEGGRVLGEFRGTLVRVGTDAITGSRSSGEPAWTIPLDDLGHGIGASELAVSPKADPTPGLALLDGGGGMGPLIDLESGEVLAPAVRDAARDSSSATTALLDEDGLTVLDAAGDEQLSMSVSSEATLEAVVGVLVYLRDGTSVRVHNGVTGGVAQAYAQDGDGAVALPVHVTPHGSGTLQVGDRTLLATSRVTDDHR